MSSGLPIAGSNTTVCPTLPNTNVTDAPVVALATAGEKASDASA
jgi:hypothetical protein